MTQEALVQDTKEASHRWTHRSSTDETAHPGNHGNSHQDDTAELCISPSPQEKAEFVRYASLSKVSAETTHGTPPQPQATENETKQKQTIGVDQTTRNEIKRKKRRRKPKMRTK